jgi:subtilisin family serine protease
VPDALKEEVAFAYLPTPPTYHAESPIAPKTSLHHLTLDEVRRVLGATRCHRRGWTGKGVHVAMVDSGFSRHPYFTSSGFNYKAVATVQQPNPMVDPSGHGTGESANIFTMAPDIVFSGIRFGGSAAEDIESAITTGAQIITNSWGWSEDTMNWQNLKLQKPSLYYEFQDIADLIEEATSNGTVVIFSAGNGHYAFPGSHPEVISAGGVTVSETGDMSASNYASSFQSSLYPNRSVPDFCGLVGESTSAPMPSHIMLPVPNNCSLEGDNLPTDKSKLGWGIFSGTSAAAPQIAGAVALIIAARSSAGLEPLSTAQIKSILMSSCIDIERGQSSMGDTAMPGIDQATGSGLVDVFSACIAATNE